MNPPHTPYELVPQRYVEEYADLSDEDLLTRSNIPPKGTKWGDYYRENIRNYFAMITGVDDQFARIIKALDESGLTDNTIVVFTSDHGNCLGIHDMISKCNPFEESLRVPFIIRWPGEIPARRDDLLLSAPDIYPTLMDLMGFAADTPAEVEGVSYARAFKDEEQDRPQAQFCLHAGPESVSVYWRALRTHTHTLVLEGNDRGTAQTFLYNRKEDPFQLKNVAANDPEVVARLSSELDAWLRKTDDPWGDGQG
jgi:arylsulfatase A-like enzyme